jgi:UPF0716 protein FxsA
VPLLLLVLFIVLPIAELYVIIKVGEAIGVWPTIGLLILDSFVGAALLRSQGRAAWRRFNQALAEGRIPHREVFDGAMVILGGALLLTPGFITDVFGLILLLPPTRAVVRRLLVVGVFGGRVAMTWRVAQWGGDRYRRQAGARDRQPGRNGYDFDGSAREVGDGELPEGRSSEP